MLHSRLLALRPRAASAVPLATAASGPSSSWTAPRLRSSSPPQPARRRPPLSSSPALQTIGRASATTRAAPT